MPGLNSVHKQKELENKTIYKSALVLHMPSDSNHIVGLGR